MARNWTETTNNRGNVLRTSYQKNVTTSTTVKPDSNIHYVEVDMNGADLTLTGDCSASQSADEVRVTIVNTGGVDATITFDGDFEDESTLISVGEVEALSFFCTGDAFALNGLDTSGSVANDFSGWEMVVDGETTPATQVITTADTKILIDGLGSTSNKDYLPKEIRGSGYIWNRSTSDIEPINLGDAYSIRVDFTVTADAGNPTYIEFLLDIGGQATATIPIITRTISIPKTPPFEISGGMPIFCLGTFEANGGQIFMRTDTGSVTISSRSIFIARISKD